ncbi:MAG: M28 family peptidase [Acidobacteria bacterium]|nr:M28 family peptidase [Acidobacteriota bacterium]
MRTKRCLTAIPIAAVVCSFALISPLVPAAPVAALDAVAALAPERYMKHVTYLASEAMKGRGNGLAELDEAAEYIASQFRVSGLRPLGDEGTFFQRFEVTTGAQLGLRNELVFNGSALTLNDDFVPISFSNTAAFQGPVVFVGYGITAPELQYDDYRGINVTNKIVIAFRHEPQELDAKSPFNGTNATRHASFINKAINARQHGAKGIVFITDPNNHATEPDVVGPATRAAESDDAGISSVHVRGDFVEALLAKSGRDLAAIQQRIDRDLEPQSFEVPDARITIATDVARTRQPVRNVVAAVPGHDPKLRNEWVVVGAHYDHLGLGNRGSLTPSQVGQIHHGADDNASGTAGVLEIGRVAATHQQQFKRSLLFMTFAGEELGLLGSSYFTNHPTVPIAGIAGMINMDMIGRLRNDRIFVGGVGTSPAFRPWLQELNHKVGLLLDYSDSGFGSSDHTPFNTKRIPVLFFFSGLHADYHKPSDTSEKINGEGAKKVLSLVYLMLERIANDARRPQYSEVQEEPPSGGGGGYGPYFGSIPDFRDDLKGVLFADVRPGSPAAKAGLQSGDLLVEFDGRPIQNLYDFTYALRAKKPGDAVLVVVKRNGGEVKATVVLEARR